MNCISLCDISIYCSTALYAKDKECALFNRLAYEIDLVASPDADVYVKYPSNCKQIKIFNPQASNGLYDIATPNGKVEVFCEFELDQEGFTFLPRESLDIADNNFLKDIYLNQSIFLTRYLVLNQDINQPYIFIQQLEQYSDLPISISINQGSRLKYPGTSSRFFAVSFYSKIIVQTSQMIGLKANGYLYNYTSCNNDTNHRFTFYQRLLNFNVSLPCSGYASFGKIVNNGIDWKKIIPLNYFFTSEMYFGGCRFEFLSNCNESQKGYAFAVGLK